MNYHFFWKHDGIDFLLLSFFPTRMFSWSDDDDDDDDDE